MLVGSVANTLRKKTIKPSAAEVVATPEETLARKQKFLAILDKATEQFMDNLEKGNVDLTSSIDLERLAKLTLLISGEPDNITGTSGTEDETQVTTQAINPNIDKLTSLLNTDDPNVEAVYNKLFETLNTANDNYEG